MTEGRRWLKQHKWRFVIALLAVGWIGCDGSSEIKVASRAPQSDFRTCGTDALFLCISSLGKTVDIEQLRDLAPTRRQGCSMDDMVSAARALETEAQPISTSLSSLRRFQRPAVLHVNENHFIAYLGEKKGQMVLFDNQVGVFSCSIRTFKKRYRWSGTALRLGSPPTIAERIFLSSPVKSLLLLAFPLAMVHVWRTRRIHGWRRAR